MISILHVVDLSLDGGVETMFMDFIGTCAGDSRFRHIVLPLGLSSDREKRLHELRINIRHYRRSTSFDVRLASEIARIIDREKVDIVYGQGFSGNLWAWLGGALAKSHPRLVTHEHGTGWNVRALQIPFAALSYACSDRIICNSKAAARILKLRFRIDRNVRVVHNGIDPERIMLRPNGSELPHEIERIPPNSPVILFVGNVKIVKGAHLLPEIAMGVSRQFPDVVLLIVGRGSYESELRERLAAPEFADICRLCGAVRHLAPYYHRADIVILPSLREPFGNVLLEAGLVGKPVVATRIDGIPEVVLPNETGLLVSPTRPVSRHPPGEVIPKHVIEPCRGDLVPTKEVAAADFAQTICGLLADQDASRRYGSAARTRVLDSFTISRYSNDVLSELLSVADHCPSPGMRSLALGYIARSLRARMPAL